jgi:hypothetical protein
MPKGNKATNAGGGLYTNICCCGYSSVGSTIKSTQIAMRLHQKKYCIPPTIEEQSKRQTEQITNLTKRVIGSGRSVIDQEVSLVNNMGSTSSTDLTLLTNLTNIAIAKK